jgi:lipopolysaccharide export LptBFGC system permease protein LptF
MHYFPWLGRAQLNLLSASQPMISKDKLAAIVAHWPVIIVMLGIALTLIWMAALVWIPLRLLGIQ